MRVQVAGNMFIHTAADYARRYEARKGRAHHPELFLANLVDMWLAAVMAPVSKETGAWMSNDGETGTNRAGVKVR
jgi:hypothetical protein